MNSEQPMTGRSSYDPVLGRDVQYREGSTWKVLIAIAAIIAVILAAMWVGSGTSTSRAPEQPAATAPADPAATVPDAAAPATDPVQPAPSDTGSAPAPVTNQ